MQWTDTIEQVKAIICNLTNTPIHHQRLFYAGSDLDNASTLAGRGIPPHSTLLLLVWPNGADDHTQAYYPDMSEFDPKWNVDYRGMAPDKETFYRGGMPYTRPIGSMRYGLKVMQS